MIPPPSRACGGGYYDAKIVDCRNMSKSKVEDVVVQVWLLLCNHMLSNDE